MAKEAKRFVLSDETVPNHYGFYVSTDGIDLGRFEKNPVMLSDHMNANKWVLGRWVETLKEGAQLTALPEFDLEDDEAAKIAGKVERGYINGASVGLLFSHEDLAYVAGRVILVKSELIEATICPVPSNPNALQLFLKGQEDKPLTDEDVKQLCLSLKPETELNLNNEIHMKKINLGMRALIALGLKDAPKDGLDESEVESHILTLSNDLQAEKDKNKDLEAENQKLKDEAKASATAEGTAFLNAAVTAGKIKADQVAGYLSLYETNPTLVKATIDAIPATTSLSAQTAAGGTSNPGATEVKTDEDFMKLSDEAKLAFRTQHPDKYNEIFKSN